MAFEKLILGSQDIGNHDYLRTPEIVEDICITFDELYGTNLMPVFLKATEPCIVSFRDPQSVPYYLGIARRLSGVALDASNADAPTPGRGGQKVGGVFP